MHQRHAVWVRRRQCHPHHVAAPRRRIVAAVAIAIAASLLLPDSDVHGEHAGDGELAVPADAEQRRRRAAGADGEIRHGDARRGCGRHAHLHAELVQAVASGGARDVVGAQPVRRAAVNDGGWRRSARQREAEEIQELGGRGPAAGGGVELTYMVMLFACLVVTSSCENVKRPDDAGCCGFPARSSETTMA